MSRQIALTGNTHRDTPRLKHVLSGLISGGTPDTNNDDYWADGDEGVAWVSIGDMSTKARVTATEKMITDSGIASKRLRIMPPGTLIFSMYASMGHVAELAIPATINQALLGFEFGIHVDPAFVKWWLRHLQPLLVAEASSNTQDNLNADKVKNLPFPKIHICHQTFIANYLDRETARIDGLIAEKERMLALLEEKRAALISRAVTRGLDPHAPLKPSGHEWLGEIPAHWEIQPIKYLAVVGNGSTPSVENADYWDDEGYPWLNSSVVNVSPATNASRFVTEAALRECHLPTIQPPAVLVGITGQGKTRGMASVMGIEATINQHLAFIKPRTQELDTEFLYYLLGHAYAFLRSDSDGAGSTKGAITCEQLANMKIPVPPGDEQIEICTRIRQSLDVSEPLRSEIQTSLDLLTERRSALITAAVTGQIPLEEMQA
ncbi:MAG: restriction endonuclease subunit S [Alphaproteobacteria bacterium]|nr:restriction endonuclease subunit S [Alphaproteobacteria bacterium]